MTAPAAPPIRTAPRAPETSAAPVSRLRIETDPRRALHAWRRLETRLAPHADFRNDFGYGCSANWTEIWLKHYGDVVPHQFLVQVTDDGRNEYVSGMCLVTQSRERKGPFVLRPWHLGTAGEPGPDSVVIEYNRVLVEEPRRAEFHGQIAEWLLHAGRDGIALDGLAPEEWASLSQHLPSFTLRTQAARYCDLSRARAAGTDVLSQLGRSTRQGLRRKLRDYGTIETTWAEETKTAHAIVDELIELHQARWNALGKPGSFSSRRFSSFQRDVIENWVPSQRVVAFRARHQDETIGCLVLLVEGRRILDYFSGFCSFEKKPSPGMVTHVLCMQAALERGFDAYDFLVGDKQHKDNLSTDENTLVWGTWQPDTWRMRAYRALRHIRRSIIRPASGGRQPPDEACTRPTDHALPSQTPPESGG